MVQSGVPSRIDAVGADEEAGGVFDGLDGGGEADAGRALFADVVEAGEGEGEVAAALVAEEGVDLVDDDGLDGAEDLAAAFGGEHEVEGFGGGDEDVRGRLDDRLALGLGRVAGAEGGADAVRRVAEFEGDLLDLGEGVLEVALDVVAEGFQGGDVKDVDFVGERLLLGFADEAVDGDEEGGEGLAGAGGAEMRVSRPEMISGQPRAWASVGARNLRSNQVRTAGWNEARMLSDGRGVVLPLIPSIPQDERRQDVVRLRKTRLRGVSAQVMRHACEHLCG